VNAAEARRVNQPDGLHLGILVTGVEGIPLRELDAPEDREVAGHRRGRQQRGLQLSLPDARRGGVQEGLVVGAAVQAEKQGGQVRPVYRYLMQRLLCL
jgi:hypothetical protein